MLDKLTNLQFRSWKKLILQYAPTLLDLKNFDELLARFFAFMQKNNLNFDWRLHFYLLNFIKNDVPDSICLPKIVREFLQASLIRWSLSGLDHIDTKGNIAFSCLLGDQAILLWKSSDMGTGPTIKYVKLTANLAPPVDSFAELYSFHLEKIVWQPLFVRYD